MSYWVSRGFFFFYRVSLRPTRFTPNLLDITPDSTPVRSSSFPTMPIHESDWKSLTIHQKVETKEKQSSQNARFAIAVHRLVFHDVVLLCHTIPFSGRSRVVSVASTVASDPVFQQNKKNPMVDGVDWRPIVRDPTNEKPVKEKRIRDGISQARAVLLERIRLGERWPFFPQA